MKRALVVATMLALALPALAQEGPADDQPGRQAIINFLDLIPGQVTQWDELLESRRTTVDPLRDQLAGVEGQLRDLLSGEAPDPAEVGALVLEGQDLRQQIAAANRDYVEGFEEILVPEQRARLQFVRRAARALPLIPVFERFGLVMVPPPPGGEAQPGNPPQPPGPPQQ